MASDLNMNADADIYNQQLQETVTIAGEEFMYEYYYDTDNNKCIRVSESNTNESSVIVYEEERERFLIDGEVVATIEELEFTELENPCFNNGLKAAPKYTYLGSKSKKIS